MAVDFAPIGRALSSPARSAMLDLLMDGSARPAAELAAVAQVGASTASEHLAVLLGSGLVVVDARGRQRFFRLADASVAEALE
ncbi:ArsR/SmtB family transcription factor, partial [Solicola sp. PLA-1-18]|uniref:ArsR/SmtB family transcription factor n=1 Tax=Solicola sp. PLA-1-18 TaxID=3380532 RepID=UPI003B7BB3FB